MKSLLFLLALVTSLSVTAQDVGDDDFDKVVAAYINLRDAAAINDTVALRQVAEQLRRYDPSDFKTFHLVEDETMPLNGHIVFDEAFADSLSKGVNIYHQSDSLNRAIGERSVGMQSPRGRLQSKTIFIKANQTASCTFVAKGVKKIAVVAEGGGRVSMTMQGLYKNKPYTQYVDTEKVKKGMLHRTGALALREDCLSTVLMKIKNCVQKDISIVITMN
ncbi:MAG: hypothetical protein KH188_07040 [Prevotella sp.]|nr:hypothetical protein [Prevotella sp.]